MENLIKKLGKKNSNLLKITEDDNIMKKNKNNNKRDINSAKSQKIYKSDNTYKYKPIFIKEKIQNKKPKRKYETFVVENSKNNSIDISNLFENIEETQKQLRKERMSIEKTNKTLLWYQILKSYDSYHKEENDNKNKSKNKSILKKENKNINSIIEEFEELNKIYNSIKKKKEPIKKIEIKNYKDVTNYLGKEIEKIKEERKIENIIFHKKLELIENSKFKNIIKYKTPEKEKNYNDIFQSNKTKRRKSHNINNFKSEKIINQKKSKFNNNIYNVYRKEINYVMNEYNKSLYNKSKKNLLNYLRNKLKEENKNNINNNPKINFYKKTMNEIKSLIKENNLIKNKYKNISGIPNDDLNNIILNKIYNNKITKTINYKRNRFLIKKNIDTIIKKLIDELLYECIYDLNIIDKEKYEDNNKKKLIFNFNNIKENLNLLTKAEKKIIFQYNNLFKTEGSKSFPNNNNLIPIKQRKINIKLDDNIIHRIDNDRYKILENKLLDGSFYSDFNIFEIYDQFVNEQINNILDDEIKYIINKYELFVEKLCNEEIKNVENEINNS